MSWSLFLISTVLWLFFFEHFAWLKRFEAMGEHGMHAPRAFTATSKALAMVTMLNLLAFLFVYGFKVSWLWSASIVIGGYVAGLVCSLLISGSHGTLFHRVGWVGMPILSIAIWFAAFAA